MNDPSGTISNATPGRPVTIHRATADDAAVISGILTEAAEWLRSRGAPLWNSGEISPGSVIESMGSGEHHIALVGEQAAGTLRFQLDDPLVWPDSSPGESAFVHRFAVRREYAGGVVACALLDFAVERARIQGRRYLRLDCERTRDRLRKVYEDYGFAYHSDRQVGRFEVARYQLELEPFGG